MGIKVRHDNGVNWVGIGKVMKSGEIHDRSLLQNCVAFVILLFQEGGSSHSLFGPSLCLLVTRAPLSSDLMGKTKAGDQPVQFWEQGQGRELSSSFLSMR